MINSNPYVSGYILAGGKSSRMGRDKRRISIYGSTLLERACLLIENVLGNKPVIAGSNLNADYLHGCRVIGDAVGGNGPMDGLVSCLRDSKTEWILLIPVDMPFLTFPLLNQLAQNASDCLDVVLIESGGRMEPLVAMYNKSALRFWEECLLNDQLSIQIGIKKLRYRTISVSEEERSLINLNSERDLIKILPELLGKMQIPE